MGGTDAESTLWGNMFINLFLSGSPHSKDPVPLKVLGIGFHVYTLSGLR